MRYRASGVRAAVRQFPERARARSDRWSGLGPTSLAARARSRLANCGGFPPASARPLFVRGLAAGLFLVLVGLVAAPDRALAQQTLVSNLGQPHAGNALVGSRLRFAQGFTTGPHAGGYNLDFVGVYVIEENFAPGKGITVRIYEADADGNRTGNPVHILTSPTSYVENAINRFTAPNNATLQPNTEYLVDFDGQGDSTTDLQLSWTHSTAEEPTRADGWSIFNARNFNGSPDRFGRPIKISVKGSLVRAVTTDASLSALEFEDASDDSPITISPVFQSSTTNYTASVGNSVDTITIDSTTSDGSATVDIVDGSGMSIADADAVKAGHQVSLDVGSNTISIRVTARDNATTETYTLVVTRASAETIEEEKEKENEEEVPTVASLVSNTGQTAGPSAHGVGDSSFATSQGFSTGSNRGGYALESVGVHVTDEALDPGEILNVHIFTATSDGARGTLVHVLASPANYTDDAVNLFGAPAGSALEPDTDYLIVFDGTGDSPADFTVSSTDSPAEDAGKAPGWSIEDGLRVDATLDVDGDTLMISINGYALPEPATDSTAASTRSARSSLTPQARWIARLGRTVANQVVDAVDGRLRAARTLGATATFAGRTVSFDGAPGGSEALSAHAEEVRAKALAAWVRGEVDRESHSETLAVSERELFSGTSFSLIGRRAGGGSVSAWGRGAVSSFDGREGALTVDGEVGNLMLGADLTHERATVGLMLSHARGNGGYGGAGKGGIEASLTGLYPYGRYALNDRVSVWGVAGYGAGTLTQEPEGQASIETDMDLLMASIGMRGVLLEAPRGGGAEVAVKSDAMTVRTTSEAARTSTGTLAAAEVGVTRVRLGLEGSRASRLAGGASLTPSVEIGVRHDGGDAETGFGADIGAALTWSDPALGVSADLRARGLLTHADESFTERGFAGSFAWDPAPGSARGPSLWIGQTVGAEPSGGMEALLGPQAAKALETANDDGAEIERRTLEAKLGYGFAVAGGRGTGTPEIGLGLDDASREVVLGWRLEEAKSAGLVFGLHIEGARRERAGVGGTDGHRLGLGLGWRLEGARAERFEVRLEGLRLQPANDDTEHRIGLTLTAGW